MFELPFIDFFLAAFCSFLLGLSKSGIKGIAALIVTGFVLVYGAKASTGILMPLLLVGDVFAIIYYKRHVKWNHILKLMPWMVLGVLIGVLGGNYVSEEIFKYLSIDKENFPKARKMFENPIMDRDYFDSLTDQFRSPHLWKLVNNEWILRTTVNSAHVL